jgi:glycosyltransferase involved in cell wall biosynthesis
MNNNSAYPIRVTLVVLVYNQEQWLTDAVCACFEQQCEPIEILLSDDCSTDGSYALLLNLAQQYQGPHKVRVRQNFCNVGIGEHYNQVIAESRGQLIITAAGDDISLPGRVASLLGAWDASGQKADLIASHVIDMTSDGENVGTIVVGDLAPFNSPEIWVQHRPYVIGASHAFTKRMHEFFGPFDPDLAYEDQVMAFRSACLGGGLTVDAPLLRYRRGGVSSRKYESPEEYRTWLTRKFQRQQVLFRQIRKDMDTINRSDLWRGKVALYFDRAEWTLKLLAQKNLWACLKSTFSSGRIGIFWRLRYGLRSICLLRRLD